MSFVTDFFNEYETVSVQFRNLDETFASGIVTKSFPALADLTIDGIYWTGNSAERLVSEQYRPLISGVLIVDPDDLTITIKEDAKVTIDSEDYSIINVDNIAKQDEVIMISLKRYHE